MTEAEILSRGEAAKRILAEPLVIEALATIETQIIEAFHDCPTRDLEAMRVLQSELRRARKFKAILQGAMERGKLAANDLKEKEVSLMQNLSGRFRKSN